MRDINPSPVESSKGQQKLISGQDIIILFDFFSTRMFSRTHLTLAEADIHIM